MVENSTDAKLKKAFETIWNKPKNIKKRLEEICKELGPTDITKELQKTLDEEYAADDLLTEIAEKRLNKKVK